MLNLLLRGLHTRLYIRACCLGSATVALAVTALTCLSFQLGLPGACWFDQNKSQDWWSSPWRWGWSASVWSWPARIDSHPKVKSWHNVQVANIANTVQLQKAHYCQDDSESHPIEHRSHSGRADLSQGVHDHSR